MANAADRGIRIEYDTDRKSESGTSCTTGLITGRSGSRSSFWYRVRSHSICSSVDSIGVWRSGSGASWWARVSQDCGEGSRM